MDVISYMFLVIAAEFCNIIETLFQIYLIRTPVYVAPVLEQCGAIQHDSTVIRQKCKKIPTSGTATARQRKLWRPEIL